MTAHGRLLTTLALLVPAVAHAQDSTRVNRAARIPVTTLRPSAIAAAVQIADTHKVAATRLHRTDIARIVGAAPQAVKIRRADGAVEEPRGDSVTLRPGDILWTSVGDRPAWRYNVTAYEHPGARDSALALPFRMVRASTMGTQALAIVTMPTTLLYDRATGSYAGTLLLWLSDSIHPGNTDTLAPPVRLVAGLPVGSVEPPDLAFPHVNLPPASIRITTSSRDDSVPLEIRTSATNERTRLWLPVAHPLIVLAPVHETIWGYGLEQTEVHVTMPAEAGPGRHVVVLRASFSEPKPNRLELTGGETREVTIRSTGVQIDTMWADAGVFTAAPVPIAYHSPLLFFVFVLAGGLVGGWLSKVHTLRSFTVHALVGLVVAVAIAVGINLLGFTLPTSTGEAVYFVVAVIGALGGVKALTKAIAGLGGAKPA